LEPDNLTAYSNKGYAYIRNNQPKEAIEVLEPLTRKDASFVLGHYNLALAYNNSRNSDMAAKEVGKVLELDQETYCLAFKSDPAYKTWAPQTPQYQSRCSKAE
jgi:tetratricopeptide (TPR) repeat protein